MAKPNLAEKDVLNPQEAIKYFNLSNRKFYKFLSETDGGEFLAYYKERKLMIRVAFQRFLLQNPQVKEVLTNGESRQRKDKA
jgi:heat shock protein HspQ